MTDALPDGIHRWPMGFAPSRFPTPDRADDLGLLAIGGSLDIPSLIDAYQHGVFPWPRAGFPMLWFCPAQRGVLDFSRCHWSRSFRRELGRLARRPQGEWRLTANRCFSRVIHSCAEMKRTHETGTWIVPEMIRAYEDFHRAGYAFSVEVWDGEELIGGLYGVYLSGVLSGESMFFTVSGASKVALLGLITVSKGLGLRWMDTQMVSPVLETAGGRYIRRSDFLKRLIRDQGRESRPDLLRGLEERLLLLKPNECLPRD